MTTSKKPIIENAYGYVWPSVLGNGTRRTTGYIAVQRRRYSDGLIMQIECIERVATINGGCWHIEPHWRATIWHQDTGIRNGSLVRNIRTPSDIGALLRGFRAGKRGLPYGVNSARAR